MSSDQNPKSGRPPKSVGYRKPPKTFRFKKGQSGNPKGRPKEKILNLRDTFHKVIEAKIAVAGTNTPRAFDDALMRKLFHDAANGNRRQFTRFVTLARQSGFFKDLAHRQPQYGFIYLEQSAEAVARGAAMEKMTDQEIEQLVTKEFYEERKKAQRKGK